VRIPGQVDLISKGGKSNMSRKSSRKSSRKISSRGGLDEDEDEDDEDSDDSYDGVDPKETVPMNVDIEVNDDEKNLLGLDSVVEKKKPL